MTFIKSIMNLAFILLFHTLDFKVSLKELSFQLRSQPILKWEHNKKADRQTDKIMTEGKKLGDEMETGGGTSGWTGSQGRLL